MKKAISFILFIVVFIDIGNAQWQQTYWPTNVNMTCLYATSNKVYAGTQSFGIYTSTNSGAWLASNSGIEYKGVSTIATDGNNIYAGTVNSGVFLSTNNGSNWSATNNGLPSNAQVISIAISDNGLGVIIGTNTGVYQSIDNGFSWSSIGLSSYPINAIAIYENRIFVGVPNHGFYYRDGIGWTQMNTGLTNLNITAIALSDSNIYLGTYGGGVFISTIHGSSWSAANIGLTNTNVAALVTIGNNIFAGVQTGGVFLSVNNGINWSNINSGLTNFDIYSLSTNGTYLYAGTNGNTGNTRAVWKRILSEVITDIENIKENTNILIYPNPANDKIFIESTQLNKDAIISIYNIQGLLIWEGSLSQNAAISISQFSDGLYFIKFKTENGIAIEKFVKE